MTQNSRQPRPAAPQHGGVPAMTLNQHHQQQQAAAARPALDVSLWFLRNSQPVVPSFNAGPVECAEPGDLLYGCENDLLDTGTRPLAWGPQPALHHAVSPKYFCGEALSALLVVRNTSNVAAANNCRIKVDLFERAQRRTVELLSAQLATLERNGMVEYRVFTRIVEPGIYSINAHVECGVAGGGGAAGSQYNSAGFHGDNSPTGSAGASAFAAGSASVSKTFSIECDRGVEEVSRKIVPLPVAASNNSSSASGGGSDKKKSAASGPAIARFMVMFCLRNCSNVNAAALQHVSLVSKDAGVTIASSLNSPDVHMTELLRVPVCTGASAAACMDSVMQPGETRQFVWIASVAAGAATTSIAGTTPQQSSSRAGGGAAAGAAGGYQQTQQNQQHLLNVTIGVCEWQWRRSGGDGGAIRSTIINGTLNAASLPAPAPSGAAVSAAIASSPAKAAAAGPASTTTSTAAAVSALTQSPTAGASGSGSGPPSPVTALSAAASSGASGRGGTAIHHHLTVSSASVSPSPCIVGEPCELLYTVTNSNPKRPPAEEDANNGNSNDAGDSSRSPSPAAHSGCVTLNAHIAISSLLPDFMFTGGSTCIALEELAPGETATLRIPVLPLQSGVFTTEAAFELRDAAELSGQQLLVWSPAARPSNAAATKINVVCMQAT